MKAIIYTSNTGSTAEYAQLLGKKLNLPVHSLQQAKNKVLAGSEIIYLGWIMAGGIKGYKEAAKLYKVRAVCGIGMGQTGTQLKEVRDKNAIPQRIPLCSFPCFPCLSPNLNLSSSYLLVTLIIVTYRSLVNSYVWKTPTIE